MKGTLWGVGVGPGDPELLTLKAARLIESVPTVAFVCNREGASRARETARRHLQPEQLEIPISMAFESHRASAKAAYRRAAERIAEALDRGMDVAVLCEGDPMLYGSFIHILEAVGTNGPCGIVPGISSLGAAAATARKPLVSGGERLAVVPGNAGDDVIFKTLEEYDSVAILKPGRNRARIVESLRASGRLEEAVYVSAASHPTETVVSDLSELPPTPGPYFTVFLVSRH